MYEILSGKEHAAAKREKLRKKISNGLEVCGRNPNLAVLIAGNDEASIYYAGLIQRAGKKEGIEVDIYHDENTSEENFLSRISTLNTNKEVDGIIVQLPLPKGFRRHLVLNAISPLKDVDGQNDQNLGTLYTAEPKIVPATALAVLEILKLNNIDIQSKKAVIIGRSTTVGLPAAMLLIKENATVSICHSKTSNLKDYTLEADILVVSVGSAKLIDSSYVKKGAAVVDVGTNEIKGKIVGDVDFESVIKVAKVSPAVGGVGALTLACLFNNLYELYRKNIHSN